MDPFSYNLADRRNCVARYRGPNLPNGNIYIHSLFTKPVAPQAIDPIASNMESVLSVPRGYLPTYLCTQHTYWNSLRLMQH